MPSLRRAAPTASPATPERPEQWRPQRFGRGSRSVPDPLIEPSWGGVRVLARFELGHTLFVVATWRALGFGALAFKAADSRYIPSGRNNDWSIAPMPSR